MRTLKKALSLVLVLAMVFALAVPGFAADTTKKASDFKDYSKVTNKEAVDVLTAIGVINGNADGTFNPEGSFTRAEAATMITYLTLGKTVADALPTSATKFSDVPATHWAAKYVQYCADAGIVAGVGNGKFDPDAKLTATQWALMLLGALGYNAKNEGIGGQGWELATTRLAMKAGIASASDLTATFNRDMAAKFAFNTLKADVVEYSSNGTNITIGNTTIATGAGKAEKIKIATESANYAGANTNDPGYGYQQFCEAHFDKLKLTTSTDDLGRTANQWNNGALIGKYATAAAVTFTAKTSAADVATKLAGYYIKDNATPAVNHKIDNTAKTDFTAAGITVVDKLSGTTVNTATFNGVATQTLAKTIADLTANGRLVEFYADKENVINQVVVIEYTVGTVTKVVTAKNGDVTYTITNAGGAKVDYAADKADTIEVNGAIAKGDVVTMVQGTSALHVYPTTTFTGAQSKFNNAANTITVNGTTYTVGTGVLASAGTPVAMGDFGNSTKTDNTYYVDQYGFVVKTTAKAASTDYAYIVDATGKDETTLDGTTYKIEVRAVLADGTVGTYTIATEKKSDGKTYLKGTNTEITDADATATALKNAAVWGYTLDGTTMTVEALNTTLADGATTLLAADTTDTTDSAACKIEKGDTSVVAASSKTVLLNKDVTIVVYNSTSKTAKVLTGTSALGSNVLEDYKTVVTGTSSTMGTAKVIFTKVASDMLQDTTSYAFINAAKFDTVLDNGKTVYVYTGYNADGTTVELTSSSPLNPANTHNAKVGLYAYTADNKVGTLLRQQDNANTVQGSKYGYGKLHVAGQMVYLDGTTTYYNMSDAQVTYVDTTVNDVDGNVGIFVLKVVNGSVTSDVEAIYMFR